MSNVNDGVIILNPSDESRPIFRSEACYKHETQKWMCWVVRLPEDTFNPDQFKGEVILDGRRVIVVSVERKAHLPPWRKGEMVALAVKM